MDLLEHYLAHLVEVATEVDVGVAQQMVGVADNSHSHLDHWPIGSPGSEDIALQSLHLEDRAEVEEVHSSEACQNQTTESCSAENRAVDVFVVAVNAVVAAGTFGLEETEFGQN